MKRAIVARPYDYLRLHGWRPVRVGVDYVDIDDPTAAGWWMHPFDKDLKPGPPLPCYTTAEAVDVQMLNDRVALLMREGWQVEQGDVAQYRYQDVEGLAYLTHVRSMRGKAGAMRRGTMSVPLALERQRQAGWTGGDDQETILEPRAVVDTHQGLVVQWCAYCERWHSRRLPPTEQPYLYAPPHWCCSPLRHTHVVVGRVVPNADDDLD